MRPGPRLPAPLNVLMVNTAQTGGGAGRAGEVLAGALRRDGHRVGAYVRGSPEGHAHHRPAGHWRELRLALAARALGFSDLLHLSSFLWPIRREFAAADVLHLHNLHGEYVSIAALPLWGRLKPLVWTLHDFWPLTGNCATPRACPRWQRACGQCPLLGVYPLTHVDRTRFYRRLKPGLFRAARPRLVTPSQWLADRVRKIPALRRLPLRVIRLAVDVDLFTPQADIPAARRQLGLAPEWPTVLMSGNHWSDSLKGGDQAVAALRAARQQIPTLQLLVIGHQSETVLAASGLTGRAVPFLHDRTALARAYACADLLLFPSRAENYPLTILEALACGTPVVAYNVGGVPEQIEHERTGWVARDGQPEELAAGVVRVARNPGAAREMGRRGRTFVVRTSSIATVMAQYRDEYRRAIRVWCRRHGRTSPRFAPGPLSGWLCSKLGWPEPAADTFVAGVTAEPVGGRR